MGGSSGLRRFQAAEKAAWPVGRVGTAAPSGWVWYHRADFVAPVDGWHPSPSSATEVAHAREAS
eukprot:1649209-Alexandrium_andersonii.AAC.1